MVVARDAKVETMGVMAELPPDLSPFQIGTRGEWKGQGFEIIGRIRVSYAEGSWNEWCLLCGGKTTGWLAEAQGLLMISFAAETSATITDRGDFEPGRKLDAAGEEWTVTDVKETECIACEGELPFAAPPARKRFSADLVGRDGRFGSVEFDEEGTRLYVGHFAEFSELHFQNRRPVPGWSADVAQEKNLTNALSCPQCGAAVNLRAAGLSMSAVCGSCAGVIDTANPNLKLIQQAGAKVAELRPIILIGTRGNFRGVDWEAIGLCMRKDAWVSWSEYLLFNPCFGFRWLVTYRGHWSFVDRVTSIGNISGTALWSDGRDFRLFASAKTTVTAVLGEFYWKVRRGEQATLSDYISPPFILSKEVYPDLKEFTWSHGEYIEPAEVATAFGLKEPTTPGGIYLNQPNPHGLKWPTLKWWWLFSAVGVICIQLLFAAGSASHEVARTTLEFDREAQAAAALSAEKPGGEAKPNIHVTPHFKLDGRAGLVEIEGDAPVDNNWIGASIELVNAATSERFPADLELGYYHGYDDGEWSEGSNRNSISIPAVPPGEYFLTVETTADNNVRKMPLSLRVMRGGLFWSNFFLMLGLVSFYPISVLIRRHLFERSRWSESDFSPYASSDDSE